MTHVSYCAMFIRSLLLLMLAGTAALAQEASQTAIVSEIIDNIRQNEALYARIEMLGAFTYKRADSAEKLDRALESQEAKIRIVYQGDLTYVNDERISVDDSGQQRDSSILLGYDGEKTRIVKARRLANVRDDRVRAPQMQLPHEFLLNYEVMSGSLSEALASNEWNNRVAVEAQYAGRADIDGIPCIKLACVTWNKQKPEMKVTRFLWVAPDRNYLPIRMEVLNPEHHATLPKTTAWVSDLKEISPGVWFPFQATI